MPAKILSVKEDRVTIQVEVNLKGSMLEAEESILKGVNEVGALATSEALKQFDTDGSPIKVGNIKLTSRSQDNKTYQTPYGTVNVERHVYQSAQGGKIFCPLEEKARIIQGATPRFAKIISHKYSNLSAPSVSEDLLENHGRKIAVSYLQNVTDFVGSIAQAKENNWEYSPPELDDPVETLGISLDGAHVLTVADGYRESMVGTISLYNKLGERRHTVYVAASPEYGKETFLKRLEREIKQAKERYPKAKTVGIADGAKSNWSFLKEHTDKQVLDFWHASEYLASASRAIFNKKHQGKERDSWLENACHDLKHKQGAATRILNELKESTSKKISKLLQKDLDAAISYFKNNIAAGRMKYDKFVKNNLPIGSGVTEAACKVIVKQRLCGSGMRWKDKGIKMILSLRTLVKTKARWEQFWGKINQYGVPTAL